MQEQNNNKPSITDRLRAIETLLTDLYYDLPDDLDNEISDDMLSALDSIEGALCSLTGEDQDLDTD